MPGQPPDRGLVPAAGTLPDPPPLPDRVARNALDHVADMIVITDSEGTILYVNPAFSEVTGYGADEAIGGNPRLLRSGVQDDAFYAGLWQSLLAGEVWHGEIVNRRSDGTLYPDEMRITPVIEDGRPTYFVAVKRDVSQLLGALTTGAPTAVAHVDDDGRLLYANDRFEALFDAPFEELAGQEWHTRLSAEDAARIRQLVGSLDEVEEVSSRITGPTGGHLRARGSVLIGRDGRRLGAVLVLEDVTEEVERAADALAREELVRTVLDGLPDPTVLVGPDHRLVHANAAWWRQTRELPVQVGDAGDGGVMPGEPLDDPDLRELVARVVTEDGAAASIERFSDPEGGRGRWWLVRVRSIGRDQGVLLTWTDITERKQQELRLAHRAAHDGLTGLANRVGVVEALRRALAAGSVTVYFLDLDGFKEVNDRFGHAAGDELLVIVARRLERQARGSDTVGRLGGDEFVVVTPGRTDETVAANLAARIQATVEQPMRLEAATVSVGGSVGWAHAEQGEDPDLVLERADEAMYDRKRARRAGGMHEGAAE